MTLLKEIQMEKNDI